MSGSSAAAQRARVDEIMRRLDAHYGNEVLVYLEHENAWQLLFAVILSAQCTDERVNQVTRQLFQKYRSVQDFAEADIRELETDIHSTGFYHNKAKNLKLCASQLLERHGGEVPDSLEALTALAGVGRKTANVILGNIYHQPSIVVDTHVKRISVKLGLASGKDPWQVERCLMEALPREYWIRWNTHIIALGRSICTARKPGCEGCYLLELCPWGEAALGKSKTEKKVMEKKAAIEKKKE